MGRITSNVGLITGIPIADTVDQLMQVASRPRDLLQTRNQGLQQQQLAVNSLSTRLLSLQFDLGKLNVATPYDSRAIASGDEGLLEATIENGATPSIGSYQVRPAQTATSQQLISQRFEDLDDVSSTGSLSLGFGGFVDKGISLDELNGGAGVTRGEIKITDRSGNSAVIDLSLARTVDDVIDAINADAATNLSATAVGDAFVLADEIGGAGSIVVQEVGGGTTAAGLGLDGINVAAATAVGSDVFALHVDTKLRQLNDGNGVFFTGDSENVDDLAITLVDGTSAGVDLSGAATLGDVVDAINADADLTGKLTAAISADGNRLELTDSTSGGGTFSVANGVTGSAADDLGLTEAPSSGVITGRRLTSGLRDTLVTSLNGGQGVGPLGEIGIIDRQGTIGTADLSGAETLGDVVALINASAPQVSARVNQARNGIEIVDESGGVGNLTIASNDAANSAEALAITVNAAVDAVNSGTLSRQTLSEATLLSSLNNGEGITPSDISITDSDGETAAIDLNATGSEAKTVGDVIDAINAASIGVTASINAAGDGILITDTALGEQALGVKDVNGTLAADLNLTRASTTVDINGQDTQVIDGANSYSLDLADIDGSNESILLSSVNNGGGVEYSDIRITDSLGNILSFDFNGVHAGVTSVGELIDAINAEAAAQGVSVTASINNTGSGIQLTDGGGGSGNLKVEDVNGTAAADLKLLSTDETTTTVNGSGLFAAQSASQGALETIATRINELEAGVTASTFFDGAGYRLSLVVDQTGAANEILLDAGLTGFEFTETSTARDALLVVGEQPVAGSGVLISSPTNDFSGAIGGVDLTVVEASDKPVEVTVEQSGDEILDAVQDFVDAYNAIRSDLDELTDFNETDLTTGLLFGTNEALQVDTVLSRVATDRFFGVGKFQSLEEIGVSVDDQGKLQLNAAELADVFEDDPESIRTLFTHKTDGVVAKFNEAIERLAGADSGLLTNRNESLQSTIDNNLRRIDQFNESLDRQRERLLLEFFQLEQVIGQLQNNQQALANLQPIAPLVSAG